MNFSKIVPLLSIAWLAGLQTLACAQLTVDYSLDSSGFFDRVPAAKRAVEAAVADLDAALNQNLAAITENNLTVTRTVRGESFNVNLVSGNLRNPTTLATVRIPLQAGRSFVPIFVGARNLPGNDVGFAGPGGGNFSFNWPGFNDRDAVRLASLAAAEAAESILTRGEGPIVGTAMTGTDPPPEFPIQMNFGLLSGRISFDNDTNLYHFDHTTTPAADKIDFYSVALHEALHVVGMGPSDQWNNLRDGTEWTGDSVRGLRGNGRGLITTDGGHVVSGQGILSPRITDGAMQESALVPTTRRGFRISLTELDLAFLRDLGYPNAVVPPRTSKLGDFDFNENVDLTDLDRYNRNLDQRAVGSLGALDLNGNESVDQDDFETLYTTLVETSNGRIGTVAGDINLDGEVDILRDAFALVANLGSTSATSWSQGDVNADGQVDVLGDAFLLVANLGANNQ